jgi:two-component system response regulator HydG
MNPEIEGAVTHSAVRNRVKVLVVDDEANICQFCKVIIAAVGFSVQTALSARDALEIIDKGNIDIVLSDLKMPGVDGIEFLRLLKQRSADVNVVLMTGYATIETAVLAIQLGASDYIVKPFATDDLEARLQRLAERRNSAFESQFLSDEDREQVAACGMVGTSACMQDVYRTVRCYARKRQPVLITGESGTGKELIARTIHKYGANPDEPFVPIDCGALNVNLVESELFGYRRGAFTGATQDRPGLLAYAGRGTAFFDEIGELAPDLQVKLLRALQEKEFRPVGSNRPAMLEARIVAATNRNLLDAMQEGRFRLDLYYRLNILAVRLPPLRDRKSDVPALVQHFIKRHSSPEEGIHGIAPDAMELLLCHSWPGNVRELQNCVQRALAVASGPLLTPSDFAPEIVACNPTAPRPLAELLGLSDLPPELRYPDSSAFGNKCACLEKIEKNAIVHAMESAEGQRMSAAKMLGIGRTTLYRKLKHYGLADFTFDRDSSSRPSVPT